ncbi:MAG: hypothetical protein K6G37_00810 [Bacilli bacterium]|nr:hypothetical protein [Bacilli bacterium]
MKIIKKNGFKFNKKNKVMVVSTTAVCIVSLISGITACNARVVGGPTAQPSQTIVNQQVSDTTTTFDDYTNSTSATSSASMSNINVTGSSTSSTTEYTTESQTEPTVQYDFSWGDSYNSSFDAYLTNNYGYDLITFAQFYGLDGNSILQQYFVDYVNQANGTSYEYIPFEEVNYFYRFITREGSLCEHVCRDDEDSFNSHLLFGSSNNWIYMNMESPLINKYYLSYLVWSGDTYGSMISCSELESIYPSLDYSNIDAVCEVLGSHETAGSDGNAFTAEDLITQCIINNNIIFWVCRSEGIADLNVASNPETCEIFNQYLVNHFGENAPQFGQPVTREMYVEIFGEEPMQFEFLPETPVMLAENSSNSRQR